MKESRKLALYMAIIATILIISVPPFTISMPMGGSAVEYGFLLSGPPSVRAAKAQLGSLAPGLGQNMFQVSIEYVRLFVELLVVWAVYVALKITVLKPRAAPSQP